MINTQGLAEALRIATEDLHRQAERSGYIRQILRKRSSRQGYGLFLRNLEPAYHALERGLDSHAGNGLMASFNWPSLYRRQAIVNDLSALAQTAWRDTYTLLPEATTYAERIEHVQIEAPHRLLGHAYVRYIGDLSGGQIVKSILMKAPGLEAGMLSFYDFDDIPNAETFKDRFRERLDLIGEQAGIADDIVDEARRAFQLNIAISLAVQQTMEQEGASF